MKRTLAGLLIVALLVGSAMADPFVGPAGNPTLRYSINIADGVDMTALGDTDVNWGTGDVTTTGAGSFGTMATSGATTGAGATYTGIVQAEHLYSTDDINCTDDIDIGDDLRVVGLATIGETLTLTGIGTFVAQPVFRAGGLIWDDQKLYFGNDSDGAIEYDEDGDNEVKTTGTWDFDGPLKASSTLDVDGATTLDAVEIAETLNQIGVATFVAQPVLQAGFLMWDDQTATFGNDSDSTIGYDEAGDNTLDFVCSNGMTFDGGATFDDTTTLEKVAIGTSGAYFTDFTTGDNVVGIYAHDAACTGYTDGVSSTITGAGGDGNGAIRPIQASGTASATAVLGELYGGSFYAIQADGSDISGNQYGLMAYTEIEETDETDTADGYITGLLGIYDTNGVNPTVALTHPGFKAAVGGVVKDNANTQPDAVVMAFLEGDSTGTPAGAAFKAVSVRSSSGGWFNYGLDLYDEAGYGYNIGKADIRLESGAVVVENSGAPTDGATGTGDTYADTGSLLIDTTNGNGYMNRGDADSQNWDKVVVDEVESAVTGTYNPVYVTVMQTIANADAVSGSEEYILNDAVLNETVNVYTVFANALTDDVPRALVVDPAASYTGTVTIYGTDMNDAAISEVLTFSSDVAQTTAAAFKDLTNITVSDRTGGGDTTMDVGLGSRLGLNVILTDTAQVESASMDNVYEGTRATITVSATTLSLNTIDPDTANDGAKDLKVYMKVVP